MHKESITIKKKITRDGHSKEIFFAHCKYSLTF